MHLINYFAYGSNLHPARLKQRAPSAQPKSRAILPAYSLRFHKRGADDSGKCDAFYTGNATDNLYGFLYTLDTDERHLLDKAEGLGNGYRHKNTAILHDGELLNIFFYTAEQGHIDSTLKPFSWYKRLVVEGAIFNNLPDAHIQRLKNEPACKDLDKEREQLHLSILP